MDILIYIRKDEVEHLRKNGLGRFILGKTCHGKKYAEEDTLVLNALRKYNSNRMVG